MLFQQEIRSHAAPLYPEFQRSEYQDRLDRLRSHMDNEKVDLLVLWDEYNIRYFSGFHNNHWPAKTLQCAVLLIPLDGEPTIIVPELFGGVVEGFTYITDIRLHLNSHVTANIRELPQLVADTVKSFGLEAGRIGLESGELGAMYIPRPLNDIDLFRTSLENATFVEAAGIIWKCRVIKSNAEVEALKNATRAVIGGYNELMGSFRLGMNERQVGLLLRQAILERTEDCPAPMVTASSRPIPMADIPAFNDEVVLNPGDRIIFEPVPTYKGYVGSCCRVLNVGPMTDEACQRTELMEFLQDEAIAMVKPGVKTGAIMDTIKKLNAEKGGGDYLFDMAGHGVGLSMQEPPSIAVDEPYLIEEGMVLAIETWGIDFKDVGVHVYAYEDYVTVTSDGCDPFPSFPRDRRCLPID